MDGAWRPAETGAGACRNHGPGAQAGGTNSRASTRSTAGIRARMSGRRIYRGAGRHGMERRAGAHWGGGISEAGARSKVLPARRGRFPPRTREAARVRSRRAGRAAEEPRRLPDGTARSARTSARERRACPNRRPPNRASGERGPGWASQPRPRGRRGPLGARSAPDRHSRPRNESSRPWRARSRRRAPAPGPWMDPRDYGNRAGRAARSSRWCLATDWETRKGRLLRDLAPASTKELYPHAVLRARDENRADRPHPRPPEGR